MLSMKVVLSLTLLLGTASAGLAGPKDAFWPKDTSRNSAASVRHQAPVRAYGSYAYGGRAHAFVPGAARASQIARSPETYIDIQTRSVREWIGS
jgi:hypothetical protein